MLEVRVSRRSAMRMLKWTSSTTHLRRALMVRSMRLRETATSSSLAPRANVWIDRQQQANRSADGSLADLE